MGQLNSQTSPKVRIMTRTVQSYPVMGQPNSQTSPKVRIMTRTVQSYPVMGQLNSQTSPKVRTVTRVNYTDKKENNIFFSNIAKSRLTTSSYMVKYLCISSYNRKPFLIYDFAPDPI
jgi:hypothetical protein